MSDNTENPQLNQLVSFIQHDIPGLTDGIYRLEATQEVLDSAEHVISDDSLTTTYNFAVTGDRFRLKKPTEMVYSVFPAENASGLFNAVLPSVVFLKTTFPWSRYPTKTLNEEYDNNPPPPGQDTDVDLSTWLTILLLDEDDVANYIDTYPGFALPAVNATIGDLFLTSVNPNSTLGTNYSYFYQVTDTTNPLTKYMEPGDQLTDTIQILDIPLELFFKIAPTIDDLTEMAHVRKVSLVNKPTMPGISDIGEAVGSFSIVFGNRLPQETKKTYAYLVSVEKMQDFLPTSENGGPPTNSDGFVPDASKMLRLAVLKAWTFYSTGQNATFVAQLNALNNAAPPVNHVVNQDLAANTTLRLVPGGHPIPIVANALSMGYVPLNHDLRTGEYMNSVYTQDKTVSWYRGPLTPYEITNPNIELPIPSPDKVTIFDPTTGMLDTSYAAAWMLGRQMALQDTSFSVALYNWKKGLTQEVINSVENSILMESYSSVLGIEQPEEYEKTLAKAPLPRERSYVSGKKKMKLKHKPGTGNFKHQVILSLSQHKKK